MSTYRKVGIFLSLLGTGAALATVPGVQEAACSLTCATYPEAEAKVINEQPLRRLDLAGLEAPELQRLRNAIYAHHGYRFETAQLRAYFKAQQWYQEVEGFSEERLSSVDFENVQRIKAAERNISP
jgi:hypothetical protein